MSTYLKAGKACSVCGFERVEISNETLQSIIETLHPGIYSIPVTVIDKGRDSYAICPRCDAYALGIEMTEGFPFKLKSGEIATIHQLGDIWNN